MSEANEGRLQRLVGRRFEMTGTLYVFGVPVLDGLYSTNAEEVQQWRERVPRWLRWATRFQWWATWTSPQEYRDATGECKRKPANTAVSGRGAATPEAKDDGCNASA